jgi:hypothetical protein
VSALIDTVQVATPWTLVDAIDLCRRIEAVAPAFGCHVGMTGGVLYKEGPREDLDLVFYRIRQESSIDVQGLFAALAILGIQRVTNSDDWSERWCIKARFEGRDIDCLFPEAKGGEYPPKSAGATDETAVFR